MNSIMYFTLIHSSTQLTNGDVLLRCVSVAEGRILLCRLHSIMHQVSVVQSTFTTTVNWFVTHGLKLVYY